ncbi:MAG: UDP-N-acetylmuramate--L-alanine ligase [Candidatus Eisenbacteria bacterium]|uniref:UDP-N-acetylmuramate--L-alanine ligase n=1 Tax=Eiseniibacteriota bacterium TaxID=2212470 RepID=A0A937X9Y2_UNCEI|nr:UDP-N-acetylmuramate--L-alanine ligase [Candidatus Eisenbacteria bacterium]
MQGTVRRTHFVGIGGTGMCGLAEILLTLRYEVSGSDLTVTTDAVERLERLGARVFAGHAAEHVRGRDLIVVSSAIREDNPEYREARRLGIPILKRGQMLAEIMRLKYGIAVSGAHGKTTTTSLIGHLLAGAGLDPTVVVGGRVRSLGSNARLGTGDIFVAEADESDGSFLEILPTLAVVTNVDREHLDHYGDLEAIRQAFLRFMRGVPFYGAAIVCGDDPQLLGLLPDVNRPILTYGAGVDCRVRAEGIVPQARGSRFRVLAEGRDLGEFSVPVPGRHNVQNALAALSVGLFLGIPADRLRRDLATFEGVGRRFEMRGEEGGVTHIDDYAHHPTEIAAVLGAAREVFGDRRLVVLFQPHRYTRTAALGEEFARAFRDADLLALTEIYPAGERPIPGVSAEALAGPIERESGVAVRYAAGAGDATALLPDWLRPGDVLITLGAGSVWQWGDAILAEIRRRQGASAAARTGEGLRG